LGVACVEETKSSFLPFLVLEEALLSYREKGLLLRLFEELVGKLSCLS
jgi:hypothetical protein